MALANYEPKRTIALYHGLLTLSVSSISKKKDGGILYALLTVTYIIAINSITGQSVLLSPKRDVCAILFLAAC